MPETVLADDPYLIDGPQMSAAEMRRQMSGLLAHDAHPIAARAGVLQGMRLTVDSTTRVATLGAGTAVVTPVVGSAGSYVVSSATSASAVTLDARDATNPRRDRIVLRVYDETNRKQAVLEAITGTPAASPTAPATPTGALNLGTMLVPTGTGTIVWTDERPFTSTAGGVIVCTAATRPSGSAITRGQMLFETDTGRIRIYDGTSWVTTPYPEVALTSPLLSLADATWASGDTTQDAVRGANGLCDVYVQLRTTVTRTPTSTGLLGSLLVATMKPEWCPRRDYYGTFSYANAEAGSGTPGGHMVIETDGEVRLLSINPGTSIAGRASGAGPSIRFSALYTPATY